MTRDTIDRQAWEAMLDGLDGDTQQALRDELDQWAGGDVCPQIEVTLDTTGRLDSQSSPCPAPEVAPR